MTVEYIRRLRRDRVFPDGFLIQSWYDKPDRNLPEIAGFFTRDERHRIAFRHPECHVAGLVIDRLDRRIDRHRLGCMERRPLEFFVLRRHGG